MAKVKFVRKGGKPVEANVSKKKDLGTILEDMSPEAFDRALEEGRRELNSFAGDGSTFEPLGPGETLEDLMADLPPGFDRPELTSVERSRYEVGADIHKPLPEEVEKALIERRRATLH